MATLHLLQGGEVGRVYTLGADTTVLGRQNDSAICLVGKNISRHHAQILKRPGGFFLEDLASSNGTFLNGQRIPPYAPQALVEDDRLQIGGFVFALRDDAQPVAAPPDANLVIRETVSATTLRSGILGPDPAARLETVLALTKQLARALDVDSLLERLLDRLVELFPQGDRIMAIFVDGENYVLRAQRSRKPTPSERPRFSRTIVRKALEEGVGLLSDDVKTDLRFSPSETLTSMELTSAMCVPLITSEGQRLGALQVERAGRGYSFGVDDLQLLTAIAMQVGIVLENAAHQAERLREERLRREVALAREIQEGFLPDDLVSNSECEVLGRVFPAQQVAGDFYDFFPIAEGRLAFFIGDVSGKGIPAALFMVACRTLCRHLAKEGHSPSRLMAKLNDALADDNAACMFVTLIYGVLDPATGEVTLASAGHPPPLLRRADGTVDTVPLVAGRLLGYPLAMAPMSEHRIWLGPGEALVFFTDGLIEARLRRAKKLFGEARVRELAAAFDPSAPLATWAEQTRAAVEAFQGSPHLSDDLTLLLVRRRR